ncbi:MAG: hypothetical protein ACXW20_16915 [Burkholderiales bacterium]
MDERRRRWKFLIGADGTWRWQVTNLDGSESASQRSFNTLKDCTSDATHHGYVVWKPEEDRRREST